MSSIAFHSPIRTVRIHGPERANAHLLCNDMLLMALGTRREIDTPALCRLVSDLTDTPNSSLWYVALNTTIKLGPDPLRFLARMDAQCELHGYVEGQHRVWLAGIIEQGLQFNILRSHFDGSTYKDSDEEWWGWQKLALMLRESDQEPVVMSHSSGMGFPDPWMMEDTMTDDAWYRLSHREQWDTSMAVLRALNTEQSLEMKPNTFARAFFGKPITGYDLRAQLDAEMTQGQ